MLGTPQGPAWRQASAQQDNGDTKRSSRSRSRLSDRAWIKLALGGLAITIVAVPVTINVIINSGSIPPILPWKPNTPNPSLSTVDLSKYLLTTSDMEQAKLGYSWDATALTPHAATTACFVPPANPSKSAGVQISGLPGPTVGEIVESFPTVEQASQAYESFVASENDCSWTDSSNGVTRRLTPVPDSGAQTVGSTSTVWDVQSTFIGILSGGAPLHVGALIAVRSANVDCFALVGSPGPADPPDLSTIEQTIAPMLASKFESSH